jgi:regulatory protein
VKNNNKSELQARAYAFLLLKYRQRSVKEISQRLKNKKFPEEVISRTIEFLRGKKFLDDDLFARAWIKERLARYIGPRRLKQELKLKGITERVIEDNLKGAREFYSEPDTVRELVAKRSARLKDLDPRTAKRRIYGYLLRRGFSPESAIDALDRLE